MKKIIVFFIVLQSMAFAYNNVQSKVYYYKTVHDEYDRDRCYAVSEDLENRLSELNIDGLSSSAYIHKDVTMGSRNVHTSFICIISIYLDSYENVLVSKSFKKKFKGKRDEAYADCVRYRNEYVETLDNVIEVNFKLSGGGLFGLSKKYKCKIEALYIE